MTLNQPRAPSRGAGSCLGQKRSSLERSANGWNGVGISLSAFTPKSKKGGTSLKNCRVFAIGQSELPRVAALARRIWPEAFADILPTEAIAPMVDNIYAPATLAADIDLRSHQYWLATIEDRDVGYVSAYVEGGRVWIKKLYVLSETRGSGLGKALIRTVADHFGSALPIALNVNDGNHAAISFYQSQGFEVEEHVPVRMGPYDFHDFVMVRR